MKILIKNQRANFDYDVKKTYTAGIVLSGAEVKSIKDGNASLAGAYVSVSPAGVNLINCHIGPYKYASQTKYELTQTRKLLLNKHEIDQLLGKEKGLTLVPMEIFQTNRGLVKIKIGLGKTRKKVDKREYLKKKDLEREIRKII